MMRAPIILALLAVVATNSDRTSTLVQADTSSASLATSASQPDKTRSLRSADTATAQFAEERGKPAALKEAARGFILRELTPNVVKAQAASFKKSGQSGQSSLSRWYGEGGELDDFVTHIEEELHSPPMRLRQETSTNILIHLLRAEGMRQKIYTWIEEGMEEVDILRQTKQVLKTFKKGEKKHVLKIIDDWTELPDPKLEKDVDDLIRKGVDPSKVSETMKRSTHQWSSIQLKRIENTVDRWIQQHNDINMNEILVTWLMQGKTKEEVVELLQDRRFIPQERVNNRDLKAFVEMSKNSKKHISNQLVEWLEKSLPIETVAAKLEASLERPNYATKFYIEYLISFCAKSWNLDHTMALSIIKVYVDTFSHVPPT